MSAETLERSVLEGKDREQLIAIATALGLKALSRAKKGEIIDRILEQTGAGPSSAGNGNGAGDGHTDRTSSEAAARSEDGDDERHDRGSSAPPPVVEAGSAPVTLLDEHG